MAQYGRIQRTFLDSTGNPISGLTVTVRKQGATVNGLHSGAQTSFTVNDPGGITSSPQDQVAVDTGTTVRSVSSVAATNVTVGGLGFNDVADDARLTPTTNLPTLYNDAQGAETLANPLTTDSNGEVVCWAPIVPYDLHVTGATYTMRLIQDVVPEGQESVVSNIFPSASSVAFQKDTLRAHVSGSKLERWLSATVEKFSISLNASLNPVLPAHNVAGLLTIDSGGMTITAGGETITAGDLTLTAGNLVFSAAASRIVPGATSLSLRNNANSADNLLVSDAGVATVRAGLTVTAGGITVTAGDVAATASLVNTKRLGATGGTALVAGDIVLGALWGTTATKTIIAGSTDTHGTIQINSSGTGQGADAGVTLTFKDGTFTTNPFILPVIDFTNTTPAAAGEAWCASPSGATAVVFVHHAAPVPGQSYGLTWFIIK